MDSFDQPLENALPPVSASPPVTFKITENLRQNWKEISGWALFLAILAALLVLPMFAFLLFLQVQYIRSGGSLGSIILLISLCALVGLPIWLLFRFSLQLRTALRHDNTAELTRAFTNFNAVYRFQGIVLIVGLVFYLILFVIGLSMASRLM